MVDGTLHTNDHRYFYVGLSSQSGNVEMVAQYEQIELEVIFCGLFQFALWSFCAYVYIHIF